jgi:hypothetical protein
VNPDIAVIYRGDPPFKAEVVEGVEKYEFTQPHLTIFFLDGHIERREGVLMVRSTSPASPAA